MQIILMLLAFYGVAFFLKDAEFPLQKTVRTFLRARSKFFDKLFNCYFCVGMYSGLIVYCFGQLISFEGWKLAQLGSVLIYMFASATFCYAFDHLVQILENLTHTGNRASE